MSARLDRDIPGLTASNVRFYFPDRQEVWPAKSLPKKDRLALKSAGYEWWGRHWQKPFPVETNNLRPPGSMVDATHWAKTPSGEILHYRIESGNIILWRPYSKVWDITEDAPYDLYLYPFEE